MKLRRIINILFIVLILIIIIALASCGNNDGDFMIVSTSSNIYYGQDFDIKLINASKIDKTIKKNIYDEILLEIKNYEQYLTVKPKDNLINLNFNMNKTNTNIDINLVTELNKSYISCPMITLHNSTNMFNEASNYISERSFSILGSKKNISATDRTPKKIYGTGWIVKQISDYKYYLMTNWHVQLSFEKENCELIGYHHPAFDVYINFESVTNIGYGNIPNASIDSFYTDTYLYIVDFGNTIDTTTTTKLNNINNSGDVELYDTTLQLNQEIYIGGFPSSNNKKYTCSSYSFNSVNGYKDQYDSNRIKEMENINHIVAKNKYSIANTIYTNPITKVDLNPGASGSMVVTYDNADGKFKLLGIYWGYFSSNDKKVFLNGIDMLSSWVTYDSNGNVEQQWLNEDANYAKWINYDLYDLFTSLI